MKVYIAGKNEADSNGVKVAGDEPLRSNKLLGPSYVVQKTFFN